MNNWEYVKSLIPDATPVQLITREWQIQYGKGLAVNFPCATPTEAWAESARLLAAIEEWVAQ